MRLKKGIRLFVVCILALCTIAQSKQEVDVLQGEIQFAYQDFLHTIEQIPHNHDRQMNLLQLKKPKCSEVEEKARAHKRHVESFKAKQASLKVCADSVDRVMKTVVGIHEAASLDQPTLASGLIQNITAEIPHANRSEIMDKDVEAEGDQGMIDDIELAFSGFVSAIHIELFEAASTQLQQAAKQTIHHVQKMAKLLKKSIINYEKMSTSMQTLSEMWQDVAEECAEKAQKKSQVGTESSDTPQADVESMNEQPKEEATESKKVERKSKVNILSPVTLPEKKKEAGVKDQSLAPLLNGNDDGMGATPVSEAAIQISNSEEKVKVEEKHDVITADALLTNDYSRPHAKKKEKVILNPVIAKMKAKQRTDPNPQGVINAPFEENLAEDD